MENPRHFKNFNFFASYNPHYPHRNNSNTYSQIRGKQSFLDEKDDSYSLIREI